MTHVLSLSYGKDSLACLEACKLLGYPIDRVIHAEVWATDTIPADLPPMVEFKRHADRIIKERYGLTVEHVAATSRERERERLSYDRQFYTKRFNKKLNGECIYGFPMVRGAWCNSRLKMQPLNALRKADIREDVLPHSSEEGRDQARSDKRVSGTLSHEMVRQAQGESVFTKLPCTRS